jgi:hypothetical protein
LSSGLTAAPAPAVSFAIAREKVMAENNTAVKFAVSLYQYPTNIYFQERITEKEWEIFNVKAGKRCGAFAYVLGFSFISLQIGWWHYFREMNLFIVVKFFAVEFFFIVSFFMVARVITGVQQLYLVMLLNDFNTALLKPRGMVATIKNISLNTYIDHRDHHLKTAGVEVICGYLAYPANAASLAMVEDILIPADTNCADLIDEFRAANEVFLNSYNRHSPPPLTVDAPSVSALATLQVAIPPRATPGSYFQVMCELLITMFRSICSLCCRLWLLDNRFQCRCLSWLIQANLYLCL